MPAYFVEEEAAKMPASLGGGRGVVCYHVHVREMRPSDGAS